MMSLKINGSFVGKVREKWPSCESQLCVMLYLWQYTASISFANACNGQDGQAAFCRRPLGQLTLFKEVNGSLFSPSRESMSVRFPSVYSCMEEWHSRNNDAKFLDFSDVCKHGEGRKRKLKYIFVFIKDMFFRKK